ncbi:MarR family winged helix-turn-helix transcriptional regulator [Microbacterium sp. No. 7]|uniref:MarR family winged helix-turn-helix transcriptional regulator n=1 Tax=Microbacterium sp. No. 7 TaxID=1714373 RepID=UPI0006D0E9FD|nr:MarR family transcriptional regulator [Microbacterium sp. No. 7]ALJ21613.1 transcriptional regulator [Microbacterium sp. No. 7]
MTNRTLAISAWESLFRAQHDVLEDISGDFSDETLTGPEYDVLLTVTRGEGATARLRDVTANMLISQPTVSRLVDRMVARGLISKCPDPMDGRGAMVRATERGSELFRRVSTAHGRAIAARMAVLTDDELAQLKALTTKLREAAEHCEA